MSSSKGEMREVPFLKNDMQDQPATTGRPVNTSDAPGKADSELTEADADDPTVTDRSLTAS